MEARKRAQVTLPFILLVSGIIIEIAIAGAFISYFASTSSLGEKLSARAGTVAYSGIQDAMIRISENKDFASSSSQQYTIHIGNDSATVTASLTNDPTAGVYVYAITSLGSASSRRKKFSATVIVDKVTGKTKLKSLTEVPAS